MAARARRQPAPDPAPIPPPPVPPEPGAYTIDDLALFRCRFICSDEGAPVRYCGQATAPRASGLHSSWCAEHLAVVFVPWQRGGRVLHRAGRA